MISNSKFNSALQGSGLSMYALSRCSGVPYTTINEIRNGKNDINQCAAATVWRLAAALGVSPNDLINDINYLDGVKGKYKGIDFIWRSETNTVITFEHNGSTVTLDTGAFYNIPSRLQYYNIIAGWMIKEHLEHIQWEKDAKELINKRKRK